MEELFKALSDKEMPVHNLQEALDKIEFYKECAEWCDIYR